MTDEIKNPEESQEPTVLAVASLARGPIAPPDAELEMGRGFGPLTKPVDLVYDWARRNSIWPVFFGPACCAFEFIATAASRNDLARFGMEIMRASPRQADLLIVSGTITRKMAPQVWRIWQQMGEPKYVLAMGNCAVSGGVFRRSYAVSMGADNINLPVDVYVPGCPPRPEALLEGLMMLQKKIDKQSIRTVPWYRQSSVDRNEGEKQV